MASMALAVIMIDVWDWLAGWLELNVGRSYAGWLRLLNMGRLSPCLGRPRGLIIRWLGLHCWVLGGFLLPPAFCLQFNIVEPLPNLKRA